MIKFFRKIRQNLLSEGKTGKYFKYAIGEIVLVVIGILIALQVNNWHEHQKIITNEQEVLKSLEKEIVKNTEQLEKYKTRNDFYSEVTAEVILKLKQGEETFTTKEISDCFNFYSNMVNSPVLDMIVTSNSNLLVKSKNLIEEFRTLQYKYGGISKQEFYLDDFWNSKITDLFISCGFSLEYEKTDPLINLADIEKSGYSKKQFIALLNIKKDLHNYTSSRVKEALDKSEEVLQLLKYNPK